MLWASWRNLSFVRGPYPVNSRTRRTWGDRASCTCGSYILDPADRVETFRIKRMMLGRSPGPIALQRFAMILTHAVLLLTCRTQRELLSSQTSLPSNLNASTQCLVGQLHCKAL